MINKRNIFISFAVSFIKIKSGFWCNKSRILNLYRCQKKEDDNIKKNLLKKSALKYLTLACVSALTLTTVSCSEVKKSEVQSKNSTGTESKNDTPDDTLKSNDNNEDIIITMASSYNMEKCLQNEIDSFNSADNGYKIVTKRYDSDFYDEEINNVVLNDGDDLTIDFNLVQDIMNTTDIDIVTSDAFGNVSKLEILKNMGAFVDLYPFMENDPEVNTSTLNQHILSLNETNGKLCSLPMYYGLSTLIGETRYVGDKENWTVDDFISHWEQMPEGSTVNGSGNSENIYRTVLRGNLESFIDYEKAEVNFDCHEFRKILEFCNRFESNNGEKTEWNYESPQFVTSYDLRGIMSSRVFGKGMMPFPNPPYTMVGYPSENEQGAFFINTGNMYSISAKSSPEKQQGAWEFIRQFYTEEYQQENVIKKDIINYNGEEITQFSDEIGFCINNNAFEKTAQKIMNGEYYDGKYTIQDVDYTEDMPTQEDVDKMKKYFDSINRLETTIDRELWNIIEEEIMAYFVGEKSLDDTVDMIQNRASIWISEQY